MKYSNLIFLIIFLTCCDPIDRRLVIKNASQEDIFYTITQYDKLESMYDEKLAKDGVKVTFKNYVYNQGSGTRKEHLRMGSNAWENFIVKVCDNQKLHIYLFDIDVLKKYSWKEVTEKGLYKEKKSVSLEEIKVANWQIVLQ